MSPAPDINLSGLVNEYIDTGIIDNATGNFSNLLIGIVSISALIIIGRIVLKLIRKNSGR